MGNVHRSVPLMLPSTRIHIYVHNVTWVNGFNCVLLDYLEYEKGHSVDST